MHSARADTLTSHRCDDVHKWIARLVIEHIDNHQRQEAHEKAEENRQHHDGETKIILVAEKLQFAPSLCLIEFAQLCTLLANLVEDAAVGHDDDETRQEEANDEDETTRRFSILLENCA